MRSIIALLRPYQWIKNLFVIAPVVFSHSLGDPVKIKQSVIAFALFSLAASGVYAINDVLDAPADRAHPAKRARPVARGAISPALATCAGILVGGGALAASFFFSRRFFAVLLAYIALNLAYTLWAKRVPIIDLFSVALGLVLRVVAGVLAIGVFLSPWILGVTFWIALFIISAKRLMEWDTVPPENRRRVLGFYTRAFLEQVNATALIITVVLFMLYAFLEVRQHIFLISILPVAYGLLRFLMLAGERTTTDDPTRLLYRDRPLQFAICIFAAIALLTFAPFPIPYANAIDLLFKN